MKVKTLIKKLSKLNPNLDVAVLVDDDNACYHLIMMSIKYGGTEEEQDDIITEPTALITLMEK